MFFHGLGDLTIHREDESLRRTSIALPTLRGDAPPNMPIPAMCTLHDDVILEDPENQGSQNNILQKLVVYNIQTSVLKTAIQASCNCLEK